MAVKTAIPCLAAVEAYPRMAYRSRVVFSERSRPEIFCWVLEGRRSRSAWLVVGGMAVSVRNRSTSASRCRRHSSSVRAGGCLLLAPGTRRTCGQPDGDAAAEQRQVLGGHVGGDGGQALVAGQVGGVDEAAQGLCDLAGPDGLRVGLGGVLEVPEQVLACKAGG